MKERLSRHTEEVQYFLDKGQFIDDNSTEFRWSFLWGDDHLRLKNIEFLLFILQKRAFKSKSRTHPKE